MRKNNLWRSNAIAWCGEGSRPVVTVLTIVIAAASCVAGFSQAPDASFGLLVWERDAIAAGQWWRLLTAHLIHLNERHLMMNLLGLWLLTELLCERFSVAQFLSLVIVSALGVGVLLSLQPQLRWYAGFSGVLGGVWSGSAGLNWIREKNLCDLFALLALVIKLACSKPVIAGFPVVAVAHLYGALSGLLWLSLMLAHERREVFD